MRSCIPSIAQDLGVAIERLRLMEEPPFAVVLEVPLLVEAPVIGELADVTLAIVAPESVRLERAVADGMDRDDAVRRATGAGHATPSALSCPTPSIINDGSLERFAGELDAFWEEFVAVGGGTR